MASICDEFPEEELSLAQRCQLADLHILAGNAADGTKILGRPSNEHALEYRRAVAAHAEGRVSKAAILFATLAEEATKGSVDGLPSICVINRFQGLAALELGDRDRAKTFFQSCLNNDTGDYWCSYHLARLWAEEKDWPKAEAFISGALAEKKDFSTASIAATVALAQSDVELAWRRIRLALTAKPSEAAGHLLAGHIALASGRGKLAAAKHFKEAATLAPHWGRPLEELGLLYLDEPQRAEQSFLDALATGEELSTRGAYGLGLSLALQKRNEEAISSLMEATVDDSLRPLAAYNLACVLSRLGAKKEAKEWLSLATEQEELLQRAAQDEELSALVSLNGSVVSTAAAEGTTATTFDW